MPRIIFDPDAIDWGPFFEQQQVGHGYWFEGLPFQRGYGIGTVLGSLWRWLLPIASRVGKVVGKEALEAGSRIMHDVAAGENVGKSIQAETKQGLSNIVEKMNRRAQAGGGRRKKSIKRKRKSESVVGKLIKKRFDYFGPY